MKKGFTLSEVLTTLMVVGIIIAMTMPVFYNNITREKNKTVLKKTYASYMINIQQTLSSKGTLCSSLACLRAWGVTGKTEHNGALANANNFNYQICTNCVSNTSKLPADMYQQSFSSYNHPNGAYSAIYDFSGNCNTISIQPGNQALGFKACGILLIDTNGSKGPNQPCGDRFAFLIANEPFAYVDVAKHIVLPQTMLVPLGYNDAPNYSKDAYNCTAKVVYNGWKLN